MTARPGPMQTSWNQGEISPESHGRTELKQVYSAAKLMRNVEPIPQGGFRLMPRSRKAGRVRGTLTEIVPTQTTISLGPHTGPANLALYTFAAPVDVAAVSIAGFSASQALAGAIRVECLVGASWIPVAPAFAVGTAGRNRLAALAPGVSLRTQQLRIRMVVAASATTFALGSVVILTEVAGVLPVKVKPFSFSSDQVYVAVFTPHQVDFWRDGVFVGAARTGLSAAMVPDLVETQRFDTMFVFHRDFGSLRLIRAGADHEWGWDALPYRNLPEVDLGGSYAKVADSWQLFLRFPTASDPNANGVGLFVSVTVDGEETAGVEVPAGPDWNAFGANLIAAIESLPSVAPGLSHTVNPGTGMCVIAFGFYGDDNLGNVFSVSARVVNSATSAATVTHTIKGDAGGEPLFSVGRGWPACAAFYQDRLVTAGPKAKGSSLLFSATADYFDMNIEIQAGTGPILINLDTDGAERIQRLARGRHLVIFTSDAEYFISNREITRGQPINVVECSRNGSAPGVPIVASEGSLIYVAKNRSLLYAATYSDVSQAYESEPISLLASHLVEDIRDAALQRGSDETDADRLFLPRDDGVMLCALLIRNQEVGGFVRWQTDGQVRACCVDGANVPTLAVERLVDGQPVLFLERLERGLLLDCAVTIVNGVPTAAIGGLAEYEGATVWALADGFVDGPFVVNGGGITLRYPATSVTVGRWTAPVMESLPPARDVGPRIVLRRPGRIHTVRLQVIDTTSIAVGANGRPARDRPLFRAGQPTDLPQQPVTGLIPIEGITGFVDEPTVVITQTRPGQLQVRDLVMEARL